MINNNRAVNQFLLSLYTLSILSISISLSTIKGAGALKKTLTTLPMGHTSRTFCTLSIRSSYNTMYPQNVLT